jgi:cobalt-zinc-cadmium efflux system membrane fusion protein
MTHENTEPGGSRLAAKTSPSPALRRRTRAALWFALFAGTAAAVVWLVHDKRKVGQETTRSAKRDVPYLDGRFIRFSPSFAKRIELEVERPTKRPLAPALHVTGKVSFNPNRVAAIGARIGGRVRSARHVEGDVVARGAVLAEIESAELGQAQAALTAARAHLHAAEANEQRERELSQARVSSHREAELARAVAASAQADLTAAEQRLRAMGGSERGEPGVLRLTSPIAGTVVERGISRGQFVEPTLTAFRVADLRQFWLLLAVFERDLPAIHEGDRVDVTMPGQSEPLVAGSVEHVGDVIDESTRTAQVRVVIEPREHRLRAGQAVQATVHTSRPRALALSLPRDAVTSVDGKPTVFVAGTELAVEPRVIELGGQDATHVEVLSGLREDERVAVRGVFALKSEIFR